MDMQFYKLSEKVFYRDYKEAVIAINHETNEILLLNPTGAYIWHLLNSRRTIHKLANLFKHKFGLEHKMAKKDITEFLQILFLKGFVRRIGKTKQSRDGKNHENYPDKYQVTRWAAKNLIPLSVQIELTRSCNLHCTHCYLSDHSTIYLDLLSFKKILKQLKNAGALFLTLTGGEPLLHHDFEKILAIAVLQYGFSTTVYTNGTVRNKNWVNILTKYLLREIHVSLYSLKPEIHDGITGCQGSQRLALNFIRQLRKEGIRVVIKSPLFKHTIMEASFLRQYAKEIGAEWSGGPLITPRDNGDMFPTSMRASYKQIISYFSELEKDSLLIKEDIVNNIPQNLEGEKPLACLALSNSCFIDMFADLYPCSQIRKKIGNILEIPFQKLWEKSSLLMRLRETNLSHLKGCSNCELLAYCSRCPGLADLEGKDIFDISPFDCLLAQSRQKAATGNVIYKSTVIGIGKPKDVVGR